MRLERYVFDMIEQCRLSSIAGIFSFHFISFHFYVLYFLGIGVDDLFIIVQSWSNISSSVHRSRSTEERIALKHSVSYSILHSNEDL